MLYALNSDPDGSSQVLWEDGERVFCRGWRIGDDGNRSAVLVVVPAAEHPSRSSLDRLAHEFALKDELDGTWAVQPLELTNDGARPVLVLDDTGGEALQRLLGAPMDVGSCGWPSVSPRLWANSISAALSTRTSSRPTSWSTGRPAGCGSLGSVSPRACPASDRRLSLQRR
jgi:hypothetical protein